MTQPKPTPPSNDVTIPTAITIEGITWESNPIYDSETAGTYIFIALLPDGYSVEDGVAMPKITVSVGQAEQSAVDNLVTRAVVIRRGKGDKQRVVFLNDKIANAVQEYLRERKSDCPFLFVSRTGGRLDRSAINRILTTAPMTSHRTPSDTFSVPPPSRQGTPSQRWQIRLGTAMFIQP